MITVIKMTAQEFANLRKAAFNKFSSLEPVKKWLSNKHVILTGCAHDVKIEGKEEKWSSGLNTEARR